MQMLTMDPEDFVSKLHPALRARVEELQVQSSCTGLLEADVAVITVDSIASRPYNTP